MHDPRTTALADVLINHSTRLQPGEHILIEAFDVPAEPVIELVKAARRAGGHPHVTLRDNRVLATLYAEARDELLTTWADYDLHRMKLMQAYIGLRGAGNASELAAVPDERMRRQAELYGQPVHFDQRVNRTRWCVLRWPTPSMAQMAQMSTEAFEDFYFDVCTIDYGEMARAADVLAGWMGKTDRVRLVGPGDTDIEFSIKDIPVVPCSGSHNIPDGECFTAPVRDSINGVIHFNTATIYHGMSFQNVRLVFRDGRVVEADAEQNADALNGILDTDEGARYVGEFAVGFHPGILHPMKDILFDEKIAGSIHLTPGRAYEDADNGNRSAVHWDLVLIQRPEYGGGSMIFDGEVVRRDGRFVPEDLQALDRLGSGAGRPEPVGASG
jgi:aminopeptidase